MRFGHFSSVCSLGLTATFFSFSPLPAYSDVASGLTALNAGNVQEAVDAFQASYKEGDGDGAFYLGRLFEFGVGTEKDLNRAANLFAAGAEAGSVLAMNRLGLMYLDGTTLLRDYKAAAKLFCDAADLGDAEGQLSCALMLRDGKGIEQDATKATMHLEAAAASGNVAATNILGLMYLDGAGISADRAKALELFEQTAAAGNAMGLYQLARSNAAPVDGAAPDLVSAYSYANLAAVRGHQEAIVLRNQLEGQMAEGQIEEAQAMARRWTEERIAAQAAQESTAQ